MNVNTFLLLFTKKKKNRENGEKQQGYVYFT